MYPEANHKHVTVSAQQAEMSGVPVLREEHPEPNNVLDDVLQDKKGAW